jgi:hypothetical protein
MPRKPSKYLLLLLCLLLPWQAHLSAATGDTDRTGITESQWQQLSSDKAFSYVNEREYAAKKTIEDKSFDTFWDSIIRFFAGPAGQVLLWGALFLVLAYVVYYIAFSKDSNFFFRRSSKIKKKAETTVENLDDIARTDWDNLMQEAIKSGNYRNAIRYSYIRLLQLLQERQLITYRNDKTNFEYYSELGDTGYKQPFKQLSRQYEYAWYGHYAMPEQAFEQYLRDFDELKKQLYR